MFIDTSNLYFGPVINNRDIGGGGVGEKRGVLLELFPFNWDLE